MLKKCLAVVALYLFSAPLFADVILQTSINDVFNRGTNELAGSITMTVNADDFENASTLEPIFIRVTLDHNAALAETLVNQGLPASDFRSLPLFLAMELNTTSGLLNINALEETTSIVRWVAGENRFWLRVQSPSDTWIVNTLNGSTQGPDENNLVAWTLGISARSSDEQNQDATTSNLPFNTREPGTAGDPDDSASTLICVDLSGSNLETTGIESLLNFDPISFDERADLGGGVYSGNSGNPTGIDFTDDRVIARGRDRSCDVEVNEINKNNPAVALLCVPAAAENGDQEGLVKATNLIQFTITCETGANFIETGLFPGAFVRFENNTQFEYGFRFTSDVQFGTVNSLGTFAPNADGAGAFVPGTAFSTNGETLYSAIDLVYVGAVQDPLFSRTLTAQVCVWQHYLEPPTDIVLDWAVYLVSHDGERDDAPYDGNSQFADGTQDQDRRCEPSQFRIFEATWDTFGAFVPCTGVPAVIFFPYLPKLFDSSFWVGLSYVNQGGVELTDNYAIFYMENGDRFDARLPNIGVREQNTWVIGEDDLGTVGLTGVGDNNSGEVIVPTPGNGAPADSFGTTRMSMFVRGGFEAEFLDNVFDGDLDGYLLIGSVATGSVDGAYLPRNYDNDIPGQNADLPIQRSKRALLTDDQKFNVITDLVMEKAIYTDQLQGK